VAHGAVKVALAHGECSYQAPYQLTIRANEAVTLTAEAPHTLVGVVHPLRGDAEEPDQVPEEITLPYAAEQLESVLAHIEAQTTVMPMDHGVAQ